MGYRAFACQLGAPGVGLPLGLYNGGRLTFRPSALEAAYLSRLAWPRRSGEAASHWLWAECKRTTEDDKLLAARSLLAATTLSVPTHTLTYHLVIYGHLAGADVATKNTLANPQCQEWRVRPKPLRAKQATRQGLLQEDWKNPWWS